MHQLIAPALPGAFPNPPYELLHSAMRLKRSRRALIYGDNNIDGNTDDGGNPSTLATK